MLRSSKSSADVRAKPVEARKLNLVGPRVIRLTWLHAADFLGAWARAAICGSEVKGQLIATNRILPFLENDYKSDASKLTI